MLPTAFLQRPARWLETITHFRGTHTGGPNFAYDLCVSKIPAALIPSLDLSSLRAAMNAAEPVRASTLESFFLTFCPAGFRKEAMCPWYGLAEATLQVTVTAPDEPPTLLPISIQAVEKHQIIPPRDPADTRMMVGCGRVAACNRLAIVDGETGNRLPEHQVGEVWVSGPIVGQGYWNQRQATAETFENRIPGEEQTLWLNTGDLGFLSNSELFISGRAKDVLIIRGRNIYPQDIEQEVERAHSAIRPGCVAAYSLEIEG